MNKIIFILILLLLLSKFIKEIAVSPSNFRNNINCELNEDQRYADKDFDDLCSKFDGKNLLITK